MKHMPEPQPWIRIHHDWRFWAGFVLMCAAITAYIMAHNPAFIPLLRP